MTRGHVRASPVTIPGRPALLLLDYRRPSMRLFLPIREGRTLRQQIEKAAGVAPGGLLVRLNDGRQAVVAIQVHYFVPGGDEILDELLVGIGTGVNLRRSA
jgi:hypothetical protein